MRLQLLDLVITADIEALEQERRLQPLSIELRDIHANRQLVDGYHLGYVHERYPSRSIDTVIGSSGG